MILLWGIAEERPLAAVRAALASMGRDAFVFDQRDSLELSLELTVGKDVRGRVVGPSRSIDLSRVSAVYARPYDPTAIPAISRRSRGSAAFRHAVELHQAFRAWTEVTPARVVNRLAAMGSNSSKPYQAALLKKLGFEVPETLVTTDPEAARGFLEAHPDAIYKSVSDARSVVARVTPEHLERLADVAGCPTQFQAYVPGTDVRVHVVGERVFPVRIESRATDYRYPGEHPVERSITTLPDAIAELCVRVARELSLPVAGIDLRHTDEGKWCCFEVNPSPAFPYFDLDGGIARAIAELLAEGGAT